MALQGVGARPASEHGEGVGQGVWPGTDARVCVCVCRKAEPYLWKLDRTENFSRMRMRLARNFNFTRHEQASKLRDTGHSSSQHLNQPEEGAELLAKVAKRMSTSLEEEDVLLEQIWSDASSVAALREGGEESGGVVSGKERERKVHKGTECQVVVLMESVSGRLDITNKHLYFLSEQAELKNQSHTCEFSLSLSLSLSLLSLLYSLYSPSLLLSFLLSSFCTLLSLPLIAFPLCRVQHRFQDSHLSLAGDSLEET